MQNIEVHAHQTIFRRGIELHLCRVPDSRVEKVAVATNIEWRDCEDYEACGDLKPLLVLDPRAGQSLMDQLWDCGLRPSEGSGSAGAMAAVQEHLKDMRDQSEKLLNHVLQSEDTTQPKGRDVSKEA